MTTFTIVESVQQIFPQLLEQQIIIELNDVQNDFARRTKILQAIGDLQSITSQVSWALVSNFLELYDVELYNSGSERVDKEDEKLDWTIDNNRLIFYSTDSSNTKITTIPTSVSTILVRYSHLPTAIAARATALTVDTQFTPAILYGTLENFFGRIKMDLGVDRNQNRLNGIDRNTRDYWGKKYKIMTIEAKKYLNMQNNATNKEARFYPHAGRIILPSAAKDANLTLVNWS